MSVVTRALLRHSSTAPSCALSSELVPPQKNTTTAFNCSPTNIGTAMAQV